MTEIEVLSMKFILIMALKNIPLVSAILFLGLVVTAIVKSQDTRPVSELSISDIISKMPQDSVTKKLQKANLLNIYTENEIKALQHGK